MDEDRFTTAIEILSGNGERCRAGDLTHALGSRDRIDDREPGAIRPVLRHAPGPIRFMRNLGLTGNLATVACLFAVSACALEPTEQQASEDPGSSDPDTSTGSVSQALTWDGVAPQTSSCWNDREFVQSTHLFIEGGGASVSTLIYLYYSPRCQTTWARLTGGTIAQPGDNNGGSAKIVRNNGPTFACNVTSTSGECITAMVNDAGLTSYAYGYEDGGAWTAWARTASF